MNKLKAILYPTLLMYCTLIFVISVQESLVFVYVISGFIIEYLIFIIAIKISKTD